MATNYTERLDAIAKALANQTLQFAEEDPEEKKKKEDDEDEDEKKFGERVSKYASKYFSECTQDMNTRLSELEKNVGDMVNMMETMSKGGKK